jgi:hypothetical protein
MLAMLFAFPLPSITMASEKEFDSEKMLSELGSKLELSKEELERLKPILKSKNEKLKQSMHDAVDKGFIQAGELADILDAISKDAEEQVKDFLNSEEVTRLRDYLKKLDEDALRKTKDKLVEELTEVLKLTEEQIAKLRPVIEESVVQLSEMLEALTKAGKANWDDFKQQYEKFSQELRKKMEDVLDNKQLERLERYQEEQEKKIQSVFFTV